MGWITGRSFDGKVSQDGKNGWAGAGALAWEICGVPEVGAGRDLRAQQLGHLAGEETEARRGAYKACQLHSCPHSHFPLRQLNRPPGQVPASEPTVLTISTAAC